jgi:hypothetical protein
MTDFHSLWYVAYFWNYNTFIRAAFLRRKKTVGRQRAEHVE